MPGRPNSSFEEIGTAATAALSEANDELQSTRIAALEEKLATIEPLLEQLQKNSGTAVAISEYVKDLRGEQVFFNYARYALGCLAGIVVMLLIALLWVAIWHPRSPLLTAPPAAIAAFVLGIVSGIVFLIVSFAKGVFRSTAERHADGFLPPALEKVVEVYDKLRS